MQKKKIFYIRLIAVFLVVFFLVARNLQEGSYLRIGGEKIKVEVADTLEKQMMGLSGREGLEKNTGLLFIFDQPAKYSFWMKDMKFSIDIIWLAPSAVEGLVKIVDIKKNALPESYPESFSPEEPASYVLEVNAGFSDQNNLKKGDEAVIKLK